MVKWTHSLTCTANLPTHKTGVSLHFERLDTPPGLQHQCLRSGQFFGSLFHGAGELGIAMRIDAIAPTPSVLLLGALWTHRKGLANSPTDS